MADDTDVIAYLFPADGNAGIGARKALHFSANYSRAVNIDGPEPSGSASGDLNYDSIASTTLPHLALRFSQPPKTRHGLVAGKAVDADVLLPYQDDVTHHHFTLTFDEQKCLIVRDLTSESGTTVIYGNTELSHGCGVDWSACGPRLAKNDPPVIKVCEELQFQLIVPEHDTTSQAYRSKVDRFLRGSAATENLFEGMEIVTRKRTKLATAGETCRKKEPPLWKTELDRGAFGVVSYVWNVTTRAEYALKEPYPNARGDWRREAEILKGISHDHIVELKYATFDPRPQLYFEFIPGGTLNMHAPTSSLQRRQVAVQLLDSLQYLHGRAPPICHRDIKPANILVSYWNSDAVHVKLADFGLSKQSNELKTRCGTELYAAPELSSNLTVQPKLSPYGPLVDIWSLAVLLAELECRGLPDCANNNQSPLITWAETVVEFVSQHLARYGANDLLSFLLENMLVVDPSKRQPAKICYEKALRLLEASQTVSSPSTSTAADDDTLRYADSTCSNQKGDLATLRTLSVQTPEWKAVSTIHQFPPEDEASTQMPGRSDLTAFSLGSGSLAESLGEDHRGLIGSSSGIEPPRLAEFPRSHPRSQDTSGSHVIAAQASRRNKRPWTREDGTPDGASFRLPGDSPASSQDAEDREASKRAKL